jgi:hypothetical protein
LIALNDDELQILMAAARPIPAHLRDQFLHACASELSKHEEIGVGVIHRVTARLQKQHINAPRLGRPHEGKWR